MINMGFLLAESVGRARLLIGANEAKQ